MSTLSAADAATRAAPIPDRLAVGCRFEFDVPQEVHAVCIVEPHETEGGRVLDEHFEAPDRRSTATYRDGFGNQCRRLALPAGRCSFSYHATVRNDDGFDTLDPDADEIDVARLPHDTLGFLIPSRYCPSDELAGAAEDLFGGLPRGWGRVDAIAAWAHEHLTFAYGSSSPTKTALDAYHDRTGVCRDFAHLMISMCRAVNLPARYVVGYLPDIAVPDPGTPMDFCAWTEVYVGGEWHTFDPRNHGQRRTGRCVIGRGRDAADVAMITIFGAAELLDMTVRAEAA